MSEKRKAGRPKGATDKAKRKARPPTKPHGRPRVAPARAKQVAIQLLKKRVESDRANHTPTRVDSKVAGALAGSLLAPTLGETPAHLSPLDYALAVMNDPTAHPTRRDAMAAIAMPFVHPKASQAETKKSLKLNFNFAGNSTSPISQAQAPQIEAQPEPGDDWDSLLSAGQRRPN
jgi:hypothetical protein